RVDYSMHEGAPHEDSDCNIDVCGAAHLACARAISIRRLAITLLRRLRSAIRPLRQLRALLLDPTHTVRRLRHPWPLRWFGPGSAHPRLVGARPAKPRLIVLRR